MSKEIKREIKAFLGVVLGMVFIGFCVLMLAILTTGSPDTSTPNLYELTRQTAENTRHIFWLIAVGFVCLFGLIGHYGRCLGKTRPHDN
jgi:nitrate reductase NapE component